MATVWSGQEIASLSEEIASLSEVIAGSHAVGYPLLALHYTDPIPRYQEKIYSF